MKKTILLITLFGTALLFSRSSKAQETDLCAEVTCSGHGTCSIENGLPFCACDEGYSVAQDDASICFLLEAHPDTSALPPTEEEADRCAGVTCSDHGICTVTREMAVCTCSPGFIRPSTGSLEARFQTCVEQSGSNYEAPSPRPRRGLMIGGLATFGGGWLFSALVGLLMLSGEGTDEGEVCINCDDVGPMLLIPLVGPFLAIPDADGTDGKVVAGLLGGVQVLGVILAAVGIGIYVSSRNRSTATRSSSLEIAGDLSLDLSRLSSGSLVLTW